VSVERAFKRVLAAARGAKLPALEVSTSYGTPAPKARGNSLMRMKDAETMVLLGPMKGAPAKTAASRRRRKTPASS
jgi:hypothetical protein